MRYKNYTKIFRKSVVVCLMAVVSVTLAGHGVKAATFSDTQNHWAKYSIDYVVDRGYFNGLSDTLFSPEEGTTRGMFATVLARHSGENLTNYGDAPFADVSSDAYYDSAVAWAFTNGISDGTSDSTFSPNEYLTREQACTMLARYCEQYGIALAERNQVQTYRDDSSISLWAKDSIYEMQKSGVMIGSDNVFSPQKNISRAEVAVLLARLDGNFFENYQDESEEEEPVEDGQIGALIDTFRSTFYCDGECCNGEWSGQTAIGAIPTPGRTIAVDSSVIPLGTWVYVDYVDARLDQYDGVYRAEDTGGAIKGNRIDMLVGSHSEALNAGVGNCNIYYYNK